MASDESADKAAVRIILHRPLYLALGMCTGVIAYFALPFEPPLAITLAISTSLSLAALVLQQRLRPAMTGLIVLLVCGLAGGFAVARLHTAFEKPTMLTYPLGPALIEGWVTSIEPGDKGVRLRLDVHAIAGEATSVLPEKVRLTHTLSLNVAPGRFVRCWGVLKPPPQPQLPGDYDFSRQAFFEGLDAVGYVQGRCKGGTLGPRDGLGQRISMWISTARRSLAIYVNRVAGERAGGFAAALASGDRSFMATEDVEALRRSGLAHLLAISGLHLGIVGTLVFFGVYRGLASWEWLALRIPAQKPAAAAAILATGVYMILSGASISTQRAFIMAGVFFGAILIDRAPLSLRSYAVAMIAVILLQPYAVMTPGFQMSFAATGLLIATYEAWNRRRREQADYRRRGIGFILQSLVVTSFVGAFATAPFALYHFDRLAPYGLFANVLAMPIVTFISAPAAGLALVAAPFGLSGIFLRIFGWSLERVLDIAWWTAGPPDQGLSLGQPMPAAVLLCLSGGLAALALGRSWRRRLVGGGVAMAFAAVVWPFAPKPLVHLAPSGDAFVFEARAVKRLQLHDGDGLGPLGLSDLPVSEDCRTRLCQLDTRKHRILLGPGKLMTDACKLSPTIIVSGRGVPDECTGALVQLTFNETLAGRSQTILQLPDGSLKAISQPCGKRPWAPCLRPD